MNEIILNMSHAYIGSGIVLLIVGFVFWVRRKKQIRRRLNRIEQLRELERKRQKENNKWDEVLKRINPHDTLARPLPRSSHIYDARY